MPLTVLSHPLVRSFATELRDKNLDGFRFRSLCSRLTTLLVIEATKELPTKDRRVESPLETCLGHCLDSEVVVVAVLRAGLGMVEPVVAILPEVQIGHVGVERDHETALPHSYYAKLPPLEGKTILLVDPMLATGGSLLHAINEMMKAGASLSAIHVLCIIAAPEGVEAIKLEHHDEIKIYTAALDRCLNDMKYILPGVGDFGDRLMGT